MMERHIPSAKVIFVTAICIAAFLRTSCAHQVTEVSEMIASHYSNNVVSPEEVIERWITLEKSAKRLSRNAVKTLMNTLLQQESNKYNISTPCMSQVIRLLSGLRDLKPWAFSFLDASGKMMEGMLEGTMSNMGEYDQCLMIKAIDERKGKQGQVMFRGKYCAIDIRPPLPPKQKYYKLTETIDVLKNFSRRNTIVGEAAKFAHLFYMMALRMGICVPSGCQPSDIAQLTDSVSNRSGLFVTVKRCEILEDIRYTSVIILVISLCSFFGLLVLIGSLIDIYSYYSGHKFTQLPVQLLLAFSFVANFRKLVSVETEPSPFSCFSGLRVLSITWIILGHTYLNINLVLFRGLKTAMDMPRAFTFQAVINATVGVDTFFFMGGVLVCYLAVKLVKELNKPFNIWLYIFHRLFRILPIYSMVVAFMFLSPLFGNGPVWHDTVDHFVNACHKNWWSNLLFINNFYHSDDMCLPQSWYVACDMQLYIVAIAVLIPLFRWPKVGLSIAGFLVLASMIGTAILTYVMGHPPTMLYVHPDHEDRIQYWASSYFKPYSHAGPYFLGMLVGYLLYVKPKMHFSLRVRTLGWGLAIICNMAVLYGVWNWNNGIEPSLAETLFYSSCHRVAWSLGVAWIVILCATGQAGVINYILTWDCWKVLGRLTYTAYLIHPIVQITAVGNVRIKLQPWHYFAVWMFFGHLFITYGCSFAASMLVEAPFLSLEKVLFGKRIQEAKDKMNAIQREKEEQEARNATDGKLQKRSGNGLGINNSNWKLRSENGIGLAETNHAYQEDEHADPENGNPRRQDGHVPIENEYPLRENRQNGYLNRENGQPKVENENARSGNVLPRYRRTSDNELVYRL